MNLGAKLKAFVAGVETWFLRLGQGPPLLVMPGLLGRDAHPAAEASSDRHTAYAPDPPGFWQSEAPTGRLTVPWLGGSWIGSFHKGVIGNRPILVLGFSAGATFLVHYAATHPGAIGKLVLYEPIIKGRDLPPWLRGLILATRIPGATAVILKWAPNLVPVLPGVNKVGWRKRMRLVEGINSPRAVGDLGRSLLSSDVTDQIQSLDVPVLIVRGDRPGGLVPLEALKSLRGPHISHLEIAGLGHFLGGKGQQSVVEAVRDFLRPSRTFR